MTNLDSILKSRDITLPIKVHLVKAMVFPVVMYGCESWTRIQHAWGWCTGMTQRDDMGRVVGAEFRGGNSCTPVVDSCQCMAKPIQYCKVKK